MAGLYHTVIAFFQQIQSADFGRFPISGSVKPKQYKGPAVEPNSA